jgi:hypothetical protein
LISGVLLAQECDKPNLVDTFAKFIYLPYLSVVEVRYREDGYNTTRKSTGTGHMARLVPVAHNRYHPAGTKWRTVGTDRSNRY